MARDRSADFEYLASLPGAVVGPAAKLPDVKPVRARGRVRHEPGRMNKTESAYARHLDTLKASGAIAAWWFEPLKLRLADRTYYSPDFMVQFDDGFLEFHEVKATWKGGKPGWEDDSRVKIKVAAEQFPLFVFVAVNKVKNDWKEERFQ